MKRFTTISMALSTDWPELCPVKQMPHFFFKDEPS